MTTRLLIVAVMLTQRHHIEGVCKPWSAATLAARRIAETFADAIANRDREDIIRRAQSRRDSVLRRALARRPQPTVDATAQRVDPPASSKRSTSAPRPALGQGQPVQSVADQLRQHHRGQA